MSHGARRRLEQNIPETPYQSGTATDPRTRLAVQQSSVRPQHEQPTQIPTGLPSAEGLAAANRSAEIRRADEAERNRRIKAEQNRIAHENEQARRSEMLAQQKNLADVARATLAHRIEQDLVQSQIIMVCEGMGATEGEVKEVGARLRAQGAERVPEMWRYELAKLRGE